MLDQFEMSELKKRRHRGPVTQVVKYGQRIERRERGEARQVALQEGLSGDESIKVRYGLDDEGVQVPGNERQNVKAWKEANVGEDVLRRQVPSGDDGRQEERRADDPSHHTVARVR